MKTKNHITLLLSLLFVTLHFSAQAQDKYEHGVVTYCSAATNSKYKIISSLNDKTTTESGNLSEGTIFDNLVPVNAKLNSLSESGWEVYSTATLGGSHYFYVRKKKM